MLVEDMKYVQYSMALKVVLFFVCFCCFFRLRDKRLQNELAEASKTKTSKIKGSVAEPTKKEMKASELALMDVSAPSICPGSPLCTLVCTNPLSLHEHVCLCVVLFFLPSSLPLSLPLPPLPSLPPSIPPG